MICDNRILFGAFLLGFVGSGLLYWWVSLSERNQYKWTSPCFGVAGLDPGIRHHHPRALPMAWMRNPPISVYIAGVRHRKRASKLYARVRGSYDYTPSYLSDNITGDNQIPAIQSALILRSFWGLWWANTYLVVTFHVHQAGAVDICFDLLFLIIQLSCWHIHVCTLYCEQWLILN